MKISYLLPELGDTGGHVVLNNFMDKLSERGHEVYAITPNQAIHWQPGMAKRITKGTASEVYLKYRIRKKIVKRINKYPRVSGLIKRMLNSEYRSVDKTISMTKGLLANWVESEVTISTLFLTAYANFALMDRTTPLYHMQHYEEICAPDKASRKLARLTYFMPFGLIANSKWLANQIKNKIGRDCYLLNPAISQKVFHPYWDIREKYSNMKKIRIVSYYDTRSFKGWKDSVASMQKVYSLLGQDKVEWTVFGGNNRPKLDIPLNYVGKIFNEDLARLYSNAHIVFMSSWYESFPLPPIEAMNCGTAVVTTRLGTEDYAYDKENSLVVPPCKPELLADAIISLAQDSKLAETIAGKGLETGREFTWDNAADKLENILKQAVNDYSYKESFSDIGKFANGEL